MEDKIILKQKFINKTDEKIVCVEGIENIRQDNETLIWFMNSIKIDYKHVLTIDDFLSQYASYTPEFEYQWATDMNCGTKVLDGFYTEEEIKMITDVYQRIDFSKRKRLYPRITHESIS